MVQSIKIQIGGQRDMTTETNPLEPPYSWALRVLEMVGELHRMGYQRLRIAPGMAATGLDWRCAITHVGNILRSHGAMLLDFSRETALYSTGSKDECFEWADARDDSPRELAGKFLERFPEIARLGRGEDQPYADWYAGMLELARRGACPSAYDDWGSDDDELSNVGRFRDAQFSMPPGGEAEPPAR